MKVSSWSVAFKAKKQFFEKRKMKACLLKSNKSFAFERTWKFIVEEKEQASLLKRGSKLSQKTKRKF